MSILAHVHSQPTSSFRLCTLIHNFPLKSPHLLSDSAEFAHEFAQYLRQIQLKMAGCLLTWMQSLLLLEDIVLLRLLKYDTFHFSMSIVIPLSIIQFLCLWLGKPKFNLTLKIDSFVCFNFTNTILKMAIINLSFQFIFSIFKKNKRWCLHKMLYLIMVCFGNYFPDLSVQFPCMSFDNVFVAWLLIYVIFLFPKRL